MGSAVSCSSPPKSHVIERSTSGSKPIKPFKESINNTLQLDSNETVQPDKELTQEKDMENDDEIDDTKKDDGTEKDQDNDPNEDDDPNEKKEPMTAEELKEVKGKKFELLKTTVSEINALEQYRNEEGEYHLTIRNGILRFNQAGYYSLKRTTLKEKQKYRQEVAQMIIDSNMLELFCDVVMKTYSDGWWDEEGKKNEKKYTPLYKTLIVLMNFSDASDDFAIAIASKYGFLEFVQKMLTDNRDRFLENAEPKMKDTEKQVTRMILSIVHNMSMRETNIHRLRNCDMINVLRPYLHSDRQMCSLCVLASLAGIINEEECEIIVGNKDLVLFLLDILRKSMKMKLRRHKGWSAKESAFTVRMLARNDANKKLLVDLGALELLVKLGRKGDIDEQNECVQALWALAFDTNNAALMSSNEQLGVVDLLVDLRQSDNPQIKKACDGALWTLRDDLKNSSVERYKEIGEKLSAEVHPARDSDTSKASASGHIMISYQWDDQELLKRVRDSIKEHGYEVWMDIDQMGGSTVQAMAEAVEGAHIFLMSMSQKYKNSPAARAEAEYAYQLRKKIIPLKMERGYCPDGWLGFILGAKLYFEFSEKYPFEKKMPALLKEIDNVCNAVGAERETAGGHQGKPEVTVKAEKRPIAHSNPQPITYPDSRTGLANAGVGRPTVSLATIEKVRLWTQSDVKDWNDRAKLEGCGVDKLSGGEIALLAVMWNESTDLVYRCLREMLNVKDFLKMSKIVWALQDL